MKRMIAMMLSGLLLAAFSVPSAHAGFWDRFKRDKQSESQTDKEKTRMGDETTTPSQQGGTSGSEGTSSEGTHDSSPDSHTGTHDSGQGSSGSDSSQY